MKLNIRALLVLLAVIISFLVGNIPASAQHRETPTATATANSNSSLGKCGGAVSHEAGC